MVWTGTKGNQRHRLGRVPHFWFTPRSFPLQPSALCGRSRCGTGSSACGPTRRGGKGAPKKGRGAQTDQSDFTPCSVDLPSFMVLLGGSGPFFRRLPKQESVVCKPIRVGKLKSTCAFGGSQLSSINGLNWFFFPGRRGGGEGLKGSFWGPSP